MHHEDRAGVNALIRGIDDLATGHMPALVVMCTNRLEALDPAVRRRAAVTVTFTRPNDSQRHAFLSPMLAELGFTDTQVRAIVQATGSTRGRDYGYTYSDLSQRLLPGLLLAAYPSKRITYDLATQVLELHPPTPPFSHAARMTDATGRSFISYRRSRAADAALLIAAQHDHGIPTWQDVKDLEEVPTGDALHEVLGNPFTASALLWITPDVKNSDVIRKIEVPNILKRASKRDGFFLVPVCAGGTTHQTASDAVDQQLSADVLSEWNLPKLAVATKGQKKATRIVASYGCEPFGGLPPFRPFSRAALALAPLRLRPSNAPRPTRPTSGFDCPLR
jgi:hypothetical protein